MAIILDVDEVIKHINRRPTSHDITVTWIAEDGSIQSGRLRGVKKHRDNTITIKTNSLTIRMDKSRISAFQTYQC